MSKAGLQIEKGQEYIAVKVEGIPLGRYAPQIFQLLSQHGLDTVRVALAQPVFSDQGIALQWFPQVSAQPSHLGDRLRYRSKCVVSRS